MDGRYYNLWSTDNDKTVPNDDKVIKSVYDPSPVGYSLPASNAFTGFTTTGGNVGVWPNPITPEDKAKLNIKGDLDKGYYFYTKPNKQGETLFFPACGGREHGNGNLSKVNTGVGLWTEGANSLHHSWFLSFTSERISPLFTNSRDYGLAVRSAEEMNPHKFNTKSEMDGVYYNLWSTDDERTEVNDDVVIKSVYDPSPVGYSLPASNAFTGFTTIGQNAGDWNIPATPEERTKFNVKGVFDRGWHFYTKPNKQDDTVFFPACGYRHYNAGSLSDMAMGGCYSMAGPTGTHYGRYLGFNSGTVGPLGYINRSFGMFVRSAEEKKMFLMCIGGR